jgi:tetratricopeptide (TPR) repeat protein
VTEDVMDTMTRSRAIAALNKVSLLTIKEQAEGGPLLSVHRLVQIVMRARLAEQGDSGDAVALALRLVGEAFPHGKTDPSDVRSWPTCAALRAHALSVLGIAPGSGDGGGHTSRLSNQLALYFLARAEYGAAEPLMHVALQIAEKGYTLDPPEVAICLNNLAVLLEATNRPAEAEPLMRRALQINEASFGPDHPDVAICLDNLAQLLQATNRLDKGEPLLCRALRIKETSFGADHPGVAAVLHNLAGLLTARNRLREAEQLARSAVDVFVASLGWDHPDTKTAVTNHVGILATIKGVSVETLLRGMREQSRASEDD